MALSVRLPERDSVYASGDIVHIDKTQHAKQQRNIPIDILRGYCIIMMITSHVNVTSNITSCVHILRYISGAEGFVFLSGLVLGIVYRRKLHSMPIVKAYNAIWKRARMLWMVNCTLVFLAVAVNSFFHYSDIPPVSSVGILRFIWLTLILKFQPGHMLNILPMYVFFLSFAPVIFELIRRGKAVWILLVSFALFIYSQWNPSFGIWQDPICGGEAFPPLVWQVLFVPGLCIGFYSGEIRSHLLEKNRRNLLYLLSGACLIIIAITFINTPQFSFYDHSKWDLFLWQREPLRYGRVLYFFLCVSVFYLLAQIVWNKNSILKKPLQMLATMGQNSLYCFLVHILFVFPLGAIAFLQTNYIASELSPVVVVAAVYLMARYHVASRLIPN